MLFDLRARGRRRTIQVVYLGLAVLMGGGLVLFGVGAGNGNGGILNAFTGNGSGNNQKQVVSQEAKAALAQTKADPNNPAGWGALLQADWTSAGQGNDYNAATSSFTATGRRELSAAVAAWQRYIQLTKTPNPDLAVLAARAYAALHNYAGEASAWQVETVASPNEAKGFECLAVSAYAAKQTRIGALATTKALSLVPKAQRTLIKSELQQAQTNPQLAQQC